MWIGSVINAAHHRWQRSILGISWKDKVNAEVRTRRGQQSMENILRERRLRWLGHVLRMDHRRITHPQNMTQPAQSSFSEYVFHALMSSSSPDLCICYQWEVPGFKRGPCRPRANWIGTVKKDLRKMTLTWEEAEVTALYRQEWRRRVAQCIHLDAGWIKVKVKEVSS